ncbi:OLC1v1010426C1 [Oldenlandia corymbosa var. corymbosa]|uniref:OLC1v1010426C1 n=1 Tax=Oldenlandia corymbosa var. corymbosa TaxID=529605 RepID=A0AAV1DRA8_OLDCO|nr:OLC1v1010426C1 [Oldenlandia corymbosa var. corymbosa]
MGYLEFFVVALIPVLKTLLITAVGLFLALERVNLLDRAARRNLNNLVFYVFSPAFVGSSLAETITMSSLIDLWFMPVNILLNMMIGSTLGWILYKITRAPRHLRGLLICCCATGNLGALPMIILPAVCKEENSPFGDSSTCSTKAQAYASLSIAIGAFFIWSYSYNIIRVDTMQCSTTFSDHDSDMLTKSSLHEALLTKDGVVASDDQAHEAQDLLLLTNYIEGNKKQVQILKKIKKQVAILGSTLNLKKIFAPSTIATLVALVIGAVTPLRHLIVGEKAPLRVIDSSVSLLGDAAVPATTLILGANLREGLKESGVGLWIIVGIQVVRFIAMPLLGTVIVRGAQHVGLVGSDPLYQFLLLLQHSVPCAMAIGTMTQLFGIGESDCAEHRIANMDFLDFFIVASIPIVKTLLIAATGLFLALRRINILDRIARHNLNNLVFYVFLPAYVGSSLADSITLRTLVELWFMPVNIILTFIIGTTLGWILTKVTGTPPHLRGLVICCCSTANLGTLPMIIIPAVCKETNSPFGDPETCSTKGQAYASLTTAIGAFFIWTYSYNIMRTEAMRFPGQNSLTLPESSLQEGLLSKDSVVPNNKIQEPQDGPLLPYSTEDKNKVPFLKKIKQQMKSWAVKYNLKKLFAPTTIATVVGLTIGAISPLRKLIVGDSAPLRVIDSTVDLLGQATVPAMTLVLGANLIEGLKKSGVGLRIITGVQVVRFVAMPLLGIAVVKGSHYIGIVGSDPLYQFLLLLHHSLPSAIAIGTMTQLFGMGESDCSVILLWNYGVALLAVTLWDSKFFNKFLSMELLDLFMVASIPVLKILIICGVGSLLASDRIGILGDSTRKQLNTVVFFVFTPSLLASSLAETVTWEKFMLLWFMPVNILLTFILGSIMGWILVKITKAAQHLKGLVITSCAAGNQGNLPMILIPAICHEKGSPFGAANSCNKYGIAYASLSMAIGAIYLWTYGYNIVRVLSTKSKNGNLDSETTSVTDNSDESSLPFLKTNNIGEGSMWNRIKNHLAAISRNVNLKNILAPPTTGAIIGFIIGSVVPLRKLLVGVNAPLHVIQDSASQLGDAAIPIVTLLVGGNIINGLRGSGVKISIISGIIVIRFILLPLMGIFVIKLASHLGFVHEDPLYQFVLLLHYSTPPAMNIGKTYDHLSYTTTKVWYGDPSFRSRAI